VLTFETVTKTDKKLNDASYALIVDPCCTIKTRLVPSPAFTNCMGELSPVVIAGKSDNAGCATVFFMKTMKKKKKIDNEVTFPR
jgi:hypothetical protein